jgi:hypothetical protein
MQQKTIIHYDLLQANATKTALEIEQLKIAGYKICIFGAGDTGSNEGFDFLTEKCLVQIDFFCDNDEKKWGALVRGIPCISVSDLKQKKEQIACIVFDQKYHIEIKKQLVSMNVAHLIPIDLIDSRNIKKTINDTYLQLAEQIIDMPQVLDIHNKTFPKYKGINKGKDVVVLGSGKSLNYYEPIENAIHIGVNLVAFFDKIKLDYLFWQHDGKDYDNYRDKILNYPCKKFFCFSEIPYASLQAQYKDIKDIEEYRISRIPAIELKPAYDISSKPLTGGWSSVIFPAIQFAFWTHPKKIYIVGCDLSSANIKYKSFHSIYDKEHNNHTKCWDEAAGVNLRKNWEKIRDFAQTMYPEIEIISINPIGLKGMFKDIYTEGFLKNNDDL